jgi:hypothetical protein
MTKTVKTLTQNKCKFSCKEKSANCSKVWIRIHWVIWVTKSDNWDRKWERKLNNWKRNYQTQPTNSLKSISMMSVKTFHAKSMPTNLKQCSTSANSMINSFSRVGTDSLLSQKHSSSAELTKVWRRQFAASSGTVSNRNPTNATYWMRNWLCMSYHWTGCRASRAEERRSRTNEKGIWNSTFMSCKWGLRRQLRNCRRRRENWVIFNRKDSSNVWTEFRWYW